MPDEAVDHAQQTQVDLSILPWLETSVGTGLLAYMLAADRQTLPAISSGEVPLSATQAGVVVALRVAVPMLRSGVTPAWAEACNW